MKLLCLALALLSTAHAATLTSAYMASSPTANLNTIKLPGTIQLSIMGIYSDGTTKAVPNAQVVWGTTNAAVMSVSSAGVVTGLSAGKANATAKIGTVASSQWTVTVSGTMPTAKLVFNWQSNPMNTSWPVCGATNKILCIASETILDVTTTAVPIATGIPAGDVTYTTTVIPAAGARKYCIEYNAFDQSGKAVTSPCSPSAVNVPSLAPSAPVGLTVSDWSTTPTTRAALYNSLNQIVR